MLKKKDGDDQSTLVEVPPTEVHRPAPNRVKDAGSSSRAIPSSRQTTGGSKSSKRSVSQSVATYTTASNGPQSSNDETPDSSASTIRTVRRRDRKGSDPIDKALEAAKYKPLTLQQAMTNFQANWPHVKLSKQQRALLQEQDRREQYLAQYLDGEINLSWRVAVIVLLVFIGLAAAKSWADAFMTLCIFMVGYLLHAVIMVVRLKRDADA